MFSPLLFNLFINKLPTVYDSQCDSVYVGDSPVNCLMWADDCVVMSTSEAGLQRSIDRTVNHFSELGLFVNTKKTKVVIFNPSGWGPAKFPNIRFFINNNLLVNADSYTYLGIIFKPSGSVEAAVKELLAKANRAYYSMSSVFYQNKKMKVDRAIELFDSLISPIAMYASQFWAVHSLPASSFSSKESLLQSWEKFLPETLNQKFCRLILSVHKKTSRLAVLGELSCYPFLIPSLVQTLKYKWTILNKSKKSSLVFKAVNEMQLYENTNIDCWLNRVNKIEQLCDIPQFQNYCKTEKVKSTIKNKMQSIFDRFYLDEINKFKPSVHDNINHNKLRTYATLKGSFKREPYIDLVQSRNQRSWITRLCCSAHSLEVERGRWNNVPVSDRCCKICHSGQLGDEYHLTMECSVFSIKRACYIWQRTSVLPGVNCLSSINQFKTMLCSTVSAA